MRKDQLIKISMVVSMLFSLSACNSNKVNNNTNNDVPVKLEGRYIYTKFKALLFTINQTYNNLSLEAKDYYFLEINEDGTCYCNIYSLSDSNDITYGTWEYNNVEKILNIKLDDNKNTVEQFKYDESEKTLTSSYYLFNIPITSQTYTYYDI